MTAFLSASVTPRLLVNPVLRAAFMITLRSFIPGCLPSVKATVGERAPMSTTAVTQRMN